MTEGRSSAPSLRLSRVLRPLAALLVAAAAFAAGCGGSSAEGDATLAVYLSAPLSGPRVADGQDVADGAQLALDDAGGEAGGTPVTLAALDDAGKRGWDAAATGANARRATEDTTTIAYIGELDSGASRTSIPITNSAGILQVSPGAGAEDLTRDSLGSNDLPSVQAGGDRTFGRVIPSDRAQGEAAAGWMSQRGITSVTVSGGETDYGAALLSGIEAAASGPQVVEDGAGSRAEATFLADPDGASLRSADPRLSGALFGSDALLDERVRIPLLRSACEQQPAACTTGRMSRVALTSAALDPSQLPPAADEFKRAFETAYDRKPGRYAAYGYEAMAVILDSIDRAEDPQDRGAVRDAFFATSERESILGTYSIDGVGNTTLAQLGAYEVRDLNVAPTAEPLALP